MCFRATSDACGTGLGSDVVGGRSLPGWNGPEEAPACGLSPPRMLGVGRVRTRAGGRADRTGAEWTCGA
jgi:hypothetical protein